MDEINAMPFYLAHRIGLLFLSIAFFGLILDIVRRGYLKERYALFWMASAVLGIVIGLFPRIIVWLALLFGFQYLTVVYVISILYLMAMVLAFTVIISQLTEKVRILAQEVAILSQKAKSDEEKCRLDEL